MEYWRARWRLSHAPKLDDVGLEALADGLERDDPQLLQGATTMPPPVPGVLDMRCEGACPLAYAGWKSKGLVSVGEVDGEFQALCERPAPEFLYWWDEAERPEARRLLLEEVRREQQARAGRQSEPPPAVGSVWDDL